MLRPICPSSSAIRRSTALLFHRFASTVNLGGEEVEIIRYPLGRQKKLLKARDAKKRKGKVISLPKPGKVLISTNERKLNLYTNEFPTKFEPPALASQTWTSTKSPGRYFVIHPTRENPSVNYEEKETSNFRELGLSQPILDALEDLSMKNPTNIQRKVIPVILQGENVMLAAETGCGKTFGYFLPIAERIMQTKTGGQENPEDGPSAIILTPSKELSSQVLEMSKSLKLPLNISSLDDRWSKKSKINEANSSDILIGTPVLALAALRRRVISLNSVRFAVVDECDTLLDESFNKYVCSILGRFNINKGISRPSQSEIRTQLILCSATFPKYAGKALEDVISMSSISSVSTGYMHRISPHVAHHFLRVRPSEKLSSLIHVLEEWMPKDDGLAMVFCNKKPTVHWLARELVYHGLHIDKIHSGLQLKDRKAIIQQASTEGSRILVCSDLSSRGINTQRTSHVINYDFPNAASDYIHRSGRVGRVGQDVSGRVTSLICKKWEIPLVMKIEEAARRRERIEGVNANIKSYHKRRWEKKAQSVETILDVSEDDAEDD